MDSYTYVSESWHTTSWLDHCISTADAHAPIEGIQIEYQFATSDHIPICISINLGHLPGHLETGSDNVKVPDRTEK